MNIKLFESIYTIFILIVIGFCVSKKKLIYEESTKIFSDLMFYITSPALIIASVTDNFSKEMVYSSFTLPLFATLATIMSLILSCIVAKIIKITEPSKKDIFYLASSFSNTIYIGLPIITSIYGIGATGYVFLFDLGSSIILWTQGLKIAKKNTIKRKTDNFKFQKFSPWNSIKNIINPPLIAIMVSIAMVLLKVPLPGVLLRPFKMLGDTTIPLSMLFIGMILAKINASRHMIDTSLIGALVVKLLLSPILMGTLLYFVRIPIMFKKVITIEAAMPSMMFTAILAKKYEKHPDFATKVVMTTNLLSVVTIPIIIYVLELIF